MFETPTIAVYSLVCITVLTNPLGRDKRQSEDNVGIFSFTEYCGLKMDADVENITQAVTNGIPGPDFCEDFILQCETTDGNVTWFWEQCGVGLWWSFTSGSCEIPSLANRYLCAAAICQPYGTAILPDPRACYGYYECLEGGVFYEFCEEGGFNPQNSACELPTTCEGVTSQTSTNVSSCTESDLPKVCPIPGYMPSLAHCGCAHQDREM